MPKIEIENDLASIEGSKSVLRVTKQKTCMQFSGDKNLLRKVVFAAADALWPEWFFSEGGRKIFLGYADGCRDGEISWATAGNIEQVWPRIQKHLQIDGVIIAIVPA